MSSIQRMVNIAGRRLRDQPRSTIVPILCTLLASGAAMLGLSQDIKYTQDPNGEKRMTQRNHVFAKHPHTTFIALHVANWPENLDAVSGWMKESPNMVVDFAAREAELGRQPQRAQRFFLEFQDRILFGTDFEPDEKIISAGWKRPMNISIIGTIGTMGGGRFMGWSSRIRRWRRCIT